MLFNAWIEIRDDFTFPADNPEDDTELQAKNRETLSKCGDIEVIPFIFKARSQGPRTWRVYSLLYDIDDSIPNKDQAIEQALERFKSENPGQADVLACWYEAGNMVGTTLVVTEEPNPDYNGDTEPATIPNPDFQPDPQLPDFDPRFDLPNPAYDGRLTLQVIGQTGVPLYPTPGYLLDVLPDVGEAPATELYDAHTYYGLPPKVMS